MTTIETSILDEDELYKTLNYRSDRAEFARCLRGITQGHLTLVSILETCGLEKALWCCRAIKTDEFDSKLRLMAVDAVTAVLGNEIKRFPYIASDKFPYQALDVAKNYALGLDTSDRKSFESRITFSKWMDEYYALHSVPNGGLQGSSISEAAVETMIPEAKLAVYFSILHAHSRSALPEFYNEDTEAKTSVVKEYLERIHQAGE